MTIITILSFLVFIEIFIKTKKGLKMEKSEKRGCLGVLAQKGLKRAKKGVFGGFQGGPKKG